MPTTLSFSRECSHTADEEVQFLVFREEKGVVEQADGFLELRLPDDERDVRFLSALRISSDRDAAAPECAEEFSGNARYVFHVLAHDGNGGKVVFHLHREH